MLHLKQSFLWVNYNGEGDYYMSDYFPLNRFDFSNLVNQIRELDALPNVLIDTETGIEFYDVNSVSKDYLVCLLEDFNSIDNLAQNDSKREYENQSRYDVKNYQFEPSWVEISQDKVTVGYVGIYVNADFSFVFIKNDSAWFLESN